MADRIRQARMDEARVQAEREAVDWKAGLVEKATVDGEALGVAAIKAE